MMASAGEPEDLPLFSDLSHLQLDKSIHQLDELNLHTEIIRTKGRALGDYLSDINLIGHFKLCLESYCGSCQRCEVNVSVEARSISVHVKNLPDLVSDMNMMVRIQISPSLPCVHGHAGDSHVFNVKQSSAKFRLDAPKVLDLVTFKISVFVMFKRPKILSNIGMSEKMLSFKLLDKEHKTPSTLQSSLHYQGSSSHFIIEAMRSNEEIKVYKISILFEPHAKSEVQSIVEKVRLIYLFEVRYVGNEVVVSGITSEALSHLLMCLEKYHGNQAVKRELLMKFEKLVCGEPTLKELHEIYLELRRIEAV